MSKTTYRDFSGTIGDIRLLSAEEYQEHKNILRTVPDEYLWLMTKGVETSRAVAVINRRGKIDYYGVDVANTGVGVKPILLLCDDSFKIGEQVNLAGTVWTVFKVKDGHTSVICDDIIAKRRFDPKGNSWVFSELKDWLQEWLVYIVEGVEELHYYPDIDLLPF